MTGKILLFLFLILTLTISATEKDSVYNNCVKNYVDSLFTSLKLETNSISGNFLTANTKDWLKINSQFSIEETGCTDYLLFYPDINNSFDPLELEILLSMENADENLFFYFLEDNLITESLYKVYFDENNNFIKTERLSIDINIDFGEIISTSYYKDKLLRFYVNNYCEKYNNISIIRIFNYDEFVLTSEEIIIINEERILHKVLTSEGITEKEICLN